ncbi:MAG: nickel-responsive transcriptional regulator NikR [Brachymonas sp.]|nr:nickel-responsive transcriptional regulator NikR [Brachymonas sp.]
MERFTISLEESLAQQFDQLVIDQGYQNRSEAVRDLLRQKLTHVNLEQDQAPFCVASLSYVYNHDARDLAERLMVYQHNYHDVVVVTTHVHLDHDNCLETTLLRGPTERVRKFGELVITERGVHHGQINIVPVNVDEHEAHGHSHEHNHMHVSPAS